MPRGKQAKIGAETTNRNGYTYVRTENGWEAKAKLVLQEAGVVVPQGAIVRFKDGDKSNFDPSNLYVANRPSSQRARLAKVEAQIAELIAERDHLKLELGDV